MSTLRHLRSILLSLSIVWAAMAHSQTDTIRYVRVSGSYGNDGRSWETATNSVQDAINDLRDYIRQHNLQSGSVYIAEGTYIPSESVETSGGSLLNTSFKIYEGIHVFGGFSEAEPEASPGLRVMKNGKTWDDNWNSRIVLGAATDEQVSEMWNLRHKTILSGNHSSLTTTITYDSIRGRFNSYYPANSYHVVWFATNGEIPVTRDSVAHHYLPLERKAWIDGCSIMYGNAAWRQTNIRSHASYGGGAYMVAGSELRNCIISHCSATMRGGGVYMDGGGRMEFCYVHTCQATGVGIVQGYGGAVDIDYDGSVEHSYLTQSCARLGGGLAICHVPGDYPWAERIKARYGREPVPTDEISNFSPFCSATVITNNTANAEAGGIYLDEGGTLNHCSVMNNDCMGPDVMYYGRRHGRSGGIYIRNCGLIYNSVFWGNTCKANNNIQFASIKQRAGAEDEILVYHTALMNHDITDWTNVSKDMVFTLERNNFPINNIPANYPCFAKPTNKSGILTQDGDGTQTYPDLHPEAYQPVRNWHPTAYTALAEKGVQVTDAVQGASKWIRHAHTSYGVVGNTFEPVSSLGALVRANEKTRHTLIAPQGMEYRSGETEPIPTLFVNPNRTGLFENGVYYEPDLVGMNWEASLKSIGDALMYFRWYLVEVPDAAIGHRAYYRLPSSWDEQGNVTGYTNYDHVQILVKEGEMTTAGRSNYLDGEMRTASIRVLSHMRIYGAYPKSNTGTSTAGRDPLNIISRISANIMGATGNEAYANNSAHVVTFINAENAVIDGFRLHSGNAHHLAMTAAIMAGGGVLVNNETTAPEKRIDMVGNQLRNCVLANNSAPKGAAVYVNGEHQKANGDVCYADLTMVNCVVRNNTSDFIVAGSTVTESHGVITANGRAYIDMNHCDMVNNVGYPFKADNKPTTGSGTIPYHGYIRVDNSLIFCNGDRVLDNRGDLGAVANVTSVNKEGQEYVFGTHNIFDADIKLHVENSTQPHGFFLEGFTKPDITGFLPSGYSSTLQIVMPSSNSVKNNQCIFTRTDRNASTYPVFMNPSRNVGHSVDSDKPLFGGTVSYMPLNTNPAVNAASANQRGGSNLPRTDVEDYDRSDTERRNYGGAPDIGAIENTNMPKLGEVVYVTPYGAGKMDGSSWENAIAGNTVYLLNDVAGPALAAGDYIDPEITCDRILDNSGKPVLTSDPKYCGGWGKVWITAMTESVTTTLTTNATIAEQNTYIGGPNDNEVTTNTFEETTSVSTPVSSTPISGFTPRYENDTRYPYGEFSGASRTFWRANPYTGTPGSYPAVTDFIAAVQANGWINNNRAERYVGGLQYAVEQASRVNKTFHKDSVQVWVGAGKYTDYKGFIMRDSVTVLGGFPTTKYATPGMSERQALMSNVISIPKAKAAKDLDPSDYETILQISDVKPIQSGNHLLNEDAIKYWDDDYSLNIIRDTETIEEATISRNNTYTWSVATTDVSTTYIRYHDMYMSGQSGNNVFAKRNKIDKNGNTANYFVTSDEDFGGVTWTSGQHVVYQYFGSPWKQTSDKNQSWELVYEDRSNNIYYSSFRFDSAKDVVDASNNTIGSVPRGMQLQGVMNTMSVWQTMKNVPAGPYRLQIDMGAYYHNYPNEVNTGITFYILASNGDTLAQQPVYCKGGKLRRYEFDFTQPATGDLTIRIKSAPGTKDVDPASPATLGSNGDKTKLNYRFVLMSNVHLYTVDGQDYILANTSENKTVTATSAPQARTISNYVTQTHRTTLRKRVLTMPDICVPTYGGGGIGDPVNMGNAYSNDELPHTDRSTGTVKDLRTASTYTKKEDSHYVSYSDVYWDGFTIRHGFLHDESMAHGGGAGVNMYEGAHLQNCVVIDNVSACRNVKGGGIFCDGATSTIEGCFVLNNTSTRGTEISQAQIFAGGMFMYEGTCFNSLFANNYSEGSAGGLGFCVGQFYNNTVAYNTCNLKEGGQYSGGAISLATTSNPNLFVANTIIYGNNGIAIRDRNTGYQNVNPFLHCYIQSADKQPNDATNRNVGNWGTKTGDKNNYGINNIYFNGVAPSASNSPFAADVTNGVYTGNSRNTNDFRLNSNSICVNHGTEDFNGNFYTALNQKGYSDAQIQNMFVYNSVKDVVLPNNDVTFTDRIKDCQIDIGAYEYDGTKFILPDTISHPGYAIYYVSHDGNPLGNASANSPLNAACKQKLQLVIDAAGRYKHALTTLERYQQVNDTPISAQPDKSWIVQVRIAGDSINTKFSTATPDTYIPTRSTKFSVANYSDNPLDYSFIVPHGVQLLGGYTTDFWHLTDSVTGNVTKTSTYDWEAYKAAVESGPLGVVDERDPLTFRTVFSGISQSVTGAAGKMYHVVTFTEDLFDYDEFILKNEDETEGGQMSVLTDERDRAVLDGIFIQDGYANSPDPDDRYGAAAVVTEYAHIRNCVVQNNIAMAYGGGLYLKPGALVSGTIVKNNSAGIGGGIYVEQPDDNITNSSTYARILSSTICHNSASTRAGGVWFDSNLRANSSVFWKNTSNDFANVAGQFSPSEIAANADFPFVFCGVEVRRIEGLGNIELSATEKEGVRWDRQDPFDDVLYYPIEMSSTLARAGMTYAQWRSLSVQFPTLDSTDIAGLSRLRWDYPGIQRPYYWHDTLNIKDNDFIEIGARVVNRSYIIKPDFSRVMYRIYVVHTDQLESDAARALQDNTRTDETSLMYRQMGSSFLNPFHRLGDAFNYIIALRKKEPQYRNRRFEVFLEQGEYVPFKNAYGEENQIRTNTFCIPECVTVVGGLDHTGKGHNYSQLGYFDRYYMDSPLGGSDSLQVVTDAGTYTLHNASTQQICEDRIMEDYNKNSVIEPWEFEKRSVLSGNTLANEEATHVYHVITCYADSSKLGALPQKFRQYNQSTGKLSNPIAEGDTANYKYECQQSKVARTIILDGLFIEGGYANHIDSVDYEEHPYQRKTYFRGGGIFVDGNWTRVFEELDYSIPNVTEPAKYNIPLIVRNSQFKDNMAANGGAIYSNGDLNIFGCHFVQNYSQGPMTKLGQSLIPWSAGGCIATNAYCGVTNCLFDNNEARRGDYPIVIDSESDEYIVDADVRQGFGGVISAAQHSQVRALNCHFVKNKAVAYPAIFNFQSNAQYSVADSMHFAVNCLFWGNEATGIDKTNASNEAKSIFKAKYSHQIDGIMHYEKDDLARYNQIYGEYKDLQDDNYLSPQTSAKLDELRALADKMEGVYFSAYEDKKGLGVAKPRPDMFVKPEEISTMQEYRAMPLPTKNDGQANLANLFTLLKGNHNVQISKDNDATTGLHFVQPSNIAGIDGYEETADWLMSRLNITTDQGWGFIKQKVKRNVDWWENTEDTNNPPLHYSDSAEAAAAFPLGGAFPVYGLDTAEFEKTDDLALYNFFSQFYQNKFDWELAPVGTQHYMKYTREGDNVQNQMMRISSYPKHGEDSVYIDMGIYEYQYVQLRLPGNEIDTIWVTNNPRNDIIADGTTWEKATDRLQDAIDLLLQSHNNHHKYVCLLGGTYAPQTLYQNRYTFMVSMPTDYLSLYLPDYATNETAYSIPSLSFLGGWSTQSKEEGRDIEKYPTIFEMRDNAPVDALNQIVVVEDMTRKFMRRTFRAHDFERDTTVVPVAFDGITFHNPYSVQDLTDGINASRLNDNGGAAIYYRFQRQHISSEGMLTPQMDIPLYPHIEVVDQNTKIELPKLTISNCIFTNNGQRTSDPQKRSSALRIDQGGGYSLIVNSLFHSGAGNPIFASIPNNAIGTRLEEVPNNVKIVNSTFALNDGHIVIHYPEAEIHNSLIWCDDLLNDTLTQLSIGSTNYVKGATTAANARITNNAVYRLFDNDADYGNQSLSYLNTDVFYGPNFVKPLPSATTTEDMLQRDFHLNPSVRTMNMAPTSVYANLVFARQYPNEPQEIYWRRAVGMHHDISDVSEDTDLSGKTRVMGGGMERGAYECRAILQRVLYVQPTKPAVMAGDGSSWQRSFGQGQLQNAIDVAAVYSYLNKNLDEETRRSYVFVKGTYDSEDERDIIARDGVSVYGSLPQNFNDTVTLNQELLAYSNAECRRFVNEVKAVRQGIASPYANPTRINSLQSLDEGITSESIFDGFLFTKGGSAIDETPIDLSSGKIVLRNAAITGYTLSDKPIVNLNSGLLYNTLIYGNSAPEIVKIGNNGLMLNTTVVTNHAGQLAVNATNARNKSIVNSITVNTADADTSRNNADAFVRCNTVTAQFAPYLNTSNAYQLPAYLTQYQQLHYQLHEQSSLINSGLENALFGVADSAANDALVNSLFADYSRDIDFKNDRDVLGNPRKINTIDVGGLETWKVLNNTVTHATNLTNQYSGDNPEVTAEDLAAKRNAFTLNYGGNMYPHDGSVLYVMDDASLVLDYDVNDADSLVQLFNRENAFRPAYTMLASGASLYGQGNVMRLSYLATEHKFANQRYALMALPYPVDVNNNYSTTYDSSTDSLTQHIKPLPFTAYNYNGAKRAAYNYRFQTDQSQCWENVEDSQGPSQGWMLDFGTLQADTTLRFTAWSNTASEYVYTEDGEDKTVVLTQYDNRTGGENGNTLNFTRAEDMGWNLKGQPYLVSDYNTSLEYDYSYAMDMPHLFYLMNGATGEYRSILAPEQVITRQSWLSGSTIPLGEAFFTQTATQGAIEPLKFALPFYSLAPNDTPGRKQIIMAPAGSPLMPVAQNNDELRETETTPESKRSYGDVLDIYPDENADKNIHYVIGRDGVKWMLNEELNSLYALNTAKTTPLSLLGQAPTETDIPLGVNIAQDNMFTFFLPDADAYSQYEYVWLIDRKLNRTVNLLEGNYTVALNSGRDNDRFLLRFGGAPVGDATNRQFIVFAHDGTLNIRGLMRGDKISVFSATGKLVHKSTATQPEFSTPLYVTGNYVVRVNNTTHKVISNR